MHSSMRSHEKRAPSPLAEVTPLLHSGTHAPSHARARLAHVLGNAKSLVHQFTRGREAGARIHANST
eukprot:6200841-Pleurochrysis_carterae.AAC.2